MKTIAILTHDEKKTDLISFAKDFKSKLKNFKLVATGSSLKN